MKWVYIFYNMIEASYRKSNTPNIEELSNQLHRYYVIGVLKD